LAKRATAIGPTVWPRWTTALDKFWTRSRNQASKRTRLSSLPATTVQRRPTRGRVTADHGGGRILRLWKPHYVRRSLSDGRGKFQRPLSATRSFTLSTSIRPLPVWVERRSGRIARLRVSINWISS